MMEYDCDVVVCGGGIAGLWAMHALRARGFHPVLIEKHTLGGQQTLAAQGILHGGMKYALDGKVDDIALRLREMPPRWLESMAGHGELDLTATQVLSDCQYMWSDGSLFSRISGAVGSKMMHGEVDSLKRESWPAAFHELDYRGSVRVLKETIIDVKSAVTALATPLSAVSYQADAMEISLSGDQIAHLDLHTQGQPSCRLKPRLAVFTAGAGNELPASLLPLPVPATQRRPLRQILVKGVPYKLYGHCVVADPKPRVTVTSHTLPDGLPVWYLGGNVAEKACKFATESEAIQFAADELAAIFPKVEWTNYEWATWDVDRAEPHQSVRFMPSEPTVNAVGNTLLAWPTKMVFAPGLATAITHGVAERISPQAASAPTLPLPLAQVGRYPWELAEWRSLEEK